MIFFTFYLRKMFQLFSQAFVQVIGLGFHSCPAYVQGRRRSKNVSKKALRGDFNSNSKGYSMAWFDRYSP
jgi:hypothetical protein